MIDTAYQGYASGDLSKDGFAARQILAQNMEGFFCQSFAKNMGMYGERIGAIHFHLSNADAVARSVSQIKILVRANYSSPPIHGADIARIVLGTPALRAEWEAELKDISGRIIKMRSLLHQTLKGLAVPGDWSHIEAQIGMFTYTGLNPAQCKVLIEKYHIYLLSNGRISMAGINTGNVEYLANAIKAVVTDPKL